MLKKGLLVFALTLVTSVALAACSASTGREATDTAAEVPAVSAQPTVIVASASRAALSLPELSPGPPAQAAADDVQVSDARAAVSSLDARDIVAAYDTVLADLYTSVLPSVVQIKVQITPRQQGSFRITQTPASGEGSGFVWSDEGHVVTNHHVIDGADKVTVSFADGSEFEAKVLGSDPDSDLAVLKIDAAPGYLHPLTLASSNTLRVGQLTLAIGSPFGQEFSMTRGIISALGRAIQAGAGNFTNPQIIQTDTSINPGNSGGPLLDRQGRVIGINSQIISNSGSNAGVGFAIPINTAKRVVPELIASGKYEYAYLGINGTSLDATLAEINSLPRDTRGVLVLGVVGGGPADRAGLSGSTGTKRVDGIVYPLGGSVITGIDRTPVKGMSDLIAYVAENTRPGEEVTLDILTGGGERATVPLSLGARPATG